MCDYIAELPTYYSFNTTMQNYTPMIYKNGIATYTLAARRNIRNLKLTCKRFSCIIKNLPYDYFALAENKYVAVESKDDARVHLQIDIFGHERIKTNTMLLLGMICRYLGSSITCEWPMKVNDGLVFPKCHMHTNLVTHNYSLGNTGKAIGICISLGDTHQHYIAGELFIYTSAKCPSAYEAAELQNERFNLIVTPYAQLLEWFVSAAHAVAI
jgi:hypothetical protein